MICLLSQVMTSYQENTTKQPIECWILTTDRAKTHRHTDKRINGFLKHKLVKHFLSNLNNNANETSASWYDVTHDDDFRRIVILKRSLNFFFLAFCGVIYQNLLHRRVYVAVSSSKLLFRQFCQKPLHITFKLTSSLQIAWACLKRRAAAQYTTRPRVLAAPWPAACLVLNIQQRIIFWSTCKMSS